MVEERRRPSRLPLAVFTLAADMAVRMSSMVRSALARAFGFTLTLMAGRSPPERVTIPTPESWESFCAMRVSARSSRRVMGKMSLVSASVMTGGSAGFTLLYTGGVGKSEGNSVRAALMPACTSCSATSSAMPRSNCRVMTEAPAEEKELICTRPDMEPNCVSRGAVTTAAMTSGDAPG